MVLSFTNTASFHVVQVEPRLSRLRLRGCLYSRITNESRTRTKSKISSAIALVQSTCSASLVSRSTHLVLSPGSSVFRESTRSFVRSNNLKSCFSCAFHWPQYSAVTLRTVKRSRDHFVCEIVEESTEVSPETQPKRAETGLEGKKGRHVTGCSTPLPTPALVLVLVLVFVLNRLSSHDLTVHLFGMMDMSLAASESFEYKGVSFCGSH